MFEEVRAVIADVLSLPEEDVQMNSLLVEDLGLDSLDAMEMVLALEKKCKVKIKDEQIMQLKSVADIVQLLTNELG
ncbi:MAG: acyl carrier protein [Eubacteriales bacterium]|nr:acyl carrier protein [Eubacteriales bacterium]